MDESLITKQLKDIGLVVKSIEILKGGQTWIHKYIIKTESEKYVLKANTSWDHKRLQEQMDIMWKLNEAETISICPIHDKPIDFKDGCGYVYKFLEGSILSKLMYQDCRISSYEYGKFVGKFHNLGKNIISSKRKTIPWKSTLKTIQRKLKLVETDIWENRETELVQSISDILHNNYDKYQSVKTHLIHNDLHPGNIIVSSQNKWTIIDMDGLGPGFVAMDLLADYWDKRNAIVTDEFLLGYKSEHELTKNEINSLPILALLRVLNSFNYFLSHPQEAYEDQLARDIRQIQLIKDFIGYAM